MHCFGFDFLYKNVTRLCIFMKSIIFYHYGLYIKILFMTSMYKTLFYNHFISGSNSFCLPTNCMNFYIFTLQKHVSAFPYNISKTES